MFFMVSISEFPNLKMESDGHIIIKSGIAFSFEKNSEITLTLEFEDKSELKFQFLFEDDDGLELPKAVCESNEKQLIVKCTGLEVPPIRQIGVNKALKIGDYLGKPLYLIFCVCGVANSVKKLEYCFFMDKEKNNERE